MEIKEHGIYERRDGVIVAWRRTDGFCYYPFMVGDGWYFPDGRFRRSGEDDHDLIREIVVGPGWLPHNGGKNPAPGKVVQVVFRSGAIGAIWPSENYTWAWEGGQFAMADILAYRLVEEAEKPSGAKDEPAPRFEFDEITIKRVSNGGYTIRDVPESLDVVGAFSNQTDLLGWLRVHLK